MSATPRRILFVLPVPGYLRFFESAIRELQQRGHVVVIALEKEGNDAAALDHARALTHVEQLSGGNRDPWLPLLDEVGRLTDYMRFMAPEFADKGYLRARMDKYLPVRFAALRGVRSVPSALPRMLHACTRLLERATPGDDASREFLTAHAPDAVIISPLVLRGTGAVRQTQILKSARHLGLPIGLAVGSWDHLSSKGLLRAQPDRVLVWNEVQRSEAVRYHGVAAARVVVTGAYHWDRWFGSGPSTSREAFLRRVGLPPDAAMITYTGSSRGIAPPDVELRFVRGWLAALRAAPDPAVRGLSVVIRPHPTNRDHWSGDGLDGFGGVAVWPQSAPPVPMTDADHATYFDTLYHSCAVVGINTSAMIEASIVGRPVLTVRGAAAAQDGTVHFGYLTSDQGGAVLVASSLDEHLRHVASAVREPELFRPAIERFVRTFVRPFGMARPAAPLFAAAVETLCDLPRMPRPVPEPWLRPVTAIARRAASRLAPADAALRGGVRRSSW